MILFIAISKLIADYALDLEFTQQCENNRTKINHHILIEFKAYALSERDESYDSRTVFASFLSISHIGPVRQDTHNEQLLCNQEKWYELLKYVNCDFDRDEDGKIITNEKTMCFIYHI